MWCSSMRDGPNTKHSSPRAGLSATSNSPPHIRTASMPTIPSAASLYTMKRALLPDIVVRAWTSPSASGQKSRCARARRACALPWRVVTLLAAGDRAEKHLRSTSGFCEYSCFQLFENHLLASLPDAELRRWLPHLERVEMPLGQVLYESGGTLSHVYFPTTAIVSLLYVMENGASAEIAVVGNEGIVGISLFMGGDSTSSRAVVQSAGLGLRLKAQTMKDDFNRAGPVLHLLLRYTQALITQMAQTAVCNRHHSLDQQLCRWLLLSLDRLQGNELVMTQELIANMLGVRREGVTQGALKLQQAGLISYARGHISVLDRDGLQKRSCECYAVVKKEYDRLLPEKSAASQYNGAASRHLVKS